MPTNRGTVQRDVLSVRLWPLGRDFLLTRWCVARQWNRFCAILYALVTVASACADGSLLEAPWFRSDQKHEARIWAHMADRWLATSAGLLTAFPNTYPLVPIAQSVWTGLWTVLAILPLVQARRTPTTSVWTWVAWQSLWHMTSAFAAASFGPIGPGHHPHLLKVMGA